MFAATSEAMTAARRPTRPFAEPFPLHLRCSGVSLGDQVGSVVAGGLNPLVAAARVLADYGRLAALTLTAALLARDTAGEDISSPR